MKRYILSIEISGYPVQVDSRKIKYVYQGRLGISEWRYSGEERGRMACFLWKFFGVLLAKCKPFLIEGINELRELPGYSERLSIIYILCMLWECGVGPKVVKVARFYSQPAWIVAQHVSDPHEGVGRFPVCVCT